MSDAAFTEPHPDHAHPAPAPSEVPYPAIRVRHLWHRFGATDVVRYVTFDVGQGPNGVTYRPSERSP